MAHRRWLIGIVAFAAIVHAVGIVRTLVPAQDGLKFLTAARRFQVDPWIDVVRGTDQHPLYPAVVAIVEPLTSTFLGPGPDSWRIAAQGVSVVASLFLLLALFALARAVFDERIALVAVFVYVLLPIPAEVGRDVLGNALGLLGMTASLLFGAWAISRDSWRWALVSGLAGGLAYIARPEAILAPASVGAAFVIHGARSGSFRSLAAVPAPAALGLAMLVCVGSYAFAKGQVSEKLALRNAAALGSQIKHVRSTPQPLPKGLDVADLDLSPKEETNDKPLGGPASILVWIVRRWWDVLCGGFAIMTVWGLTRGRFIRSACGGEPSAGGAVRLVLGVFVVVYLAAMILHASKLGYLSSRHVIPLTLISTIWSGAGIVICLRRLGDKLPISSRAWRTVVAAATFVVAMGLVGYQLRTGHESRRGHWLAGRWLSENARADERILDTRGWARFVAGRYDGYDYWHVRQALSDRGLVYVVVGCDELKADSPRAASLNALLAFAATPVQDFSTTVDGREVGTLIYRMNQPVSWEGFTP